MPVGKVVEEKGIGQVEVKPGEEMPPKPAETFLEEHERIKAEVDKAAGEARCGSIKEIATSTGYSEDNVEVHGDVMEKDKYVVKSNEDYLCSKESIDRMGEKIKRWRGVE